MDRSWMKTNRVSDDYLYGVDEFLDFAFSNTNDSDNKIRCPCVRCNNLIRKTRAEVYADLVMKGILKNYTSWVCHGETQTETDDEEEQNDNEDEIDEDEYIDDMHGMITDIYGQQMHVNDERRYETQNEVEEPNVEAKAFYALLKDAEQELYPGCMSYSRLSFIVKLMHLKCLNKWSNKSMTALLELLIEVLPKGATPLPKSDYEAKKIIKGLGLDYIKIDACQNDCVLYWKENANATNCPTCGLSRWKTDESNMKRKQVPCKILRYFPLKPRLQRLFMSSKTAEFMRWHDEGRVDDGVLRHPADALEWKEFDKNHASFSSDSRNVRLGLASDGFNPFGNMNIAYSTWPVVLVPYNLPPWMCMKQQYTFMTLLIPGPKGPGNDIDVYLRPLVDELKELWDVGVDTYDVSKKQNFSMKAAVMWTINDFPAYVNLSGWSTKGFMACPCCNCETSSKRLVNGMKQCYLGHRRFLDDNDKMRFQKSLFDGTIETNNAPSRLSGDDVVNQLEDYELVTFGKAGDKQKLPDFGKKHNWTKFSIFFELPYWSSLKLRHNLDVMHIEKNVCENIMHTVMNTKGKSKDNLKARLDMKQMNIRRSLHPQLVNGKTLLPPACYALSRDERMIMCKWFKDLKVPDGFSSNISKCVNTKEGKFTGMKTHDCHVFLEHLFPIAVRDLLPRNVGDAIVDLSMFFMNLCAKVLHVEDIDRLEQQIIIILCELEKIFPPSFFDIMEHLPIHLPWEARVGGPVQYRWMYPIERYLRTLKSYVRNKACPEGSIAEGYIADECLTFCSMYLRGVETKFNRCERNYDGDYENINTSVSVFSKSGRSFGSSTSRALSDDEYIVARLYVLENCKEVEPFIEKHKQTLEESHITYVEKIHRKEFVSWFEEHATLLYNSGSEDVNEEMLSLGRGPEKSVTCHNGYYVNGFKFLTKQRDQSKNTQHSGVVVKGDSQNGEIDYYGVLTDVIGLRYPTGDKVVLFKCLWWDVLHRGSGYKIDRYGYTSINTLKTLDNNDPFVLAAQAKQVFYARGVKDSNWIISVKAKPRNSYDMPSNNNDQLENEDAYQADAPIIPLTFENVANDENEDVWERNDVNGEFITANVNQNDEDTLIDSSEDSYDDGVDDDDMSVENDDDTSVEDGDDISTEDEF